MSTQTFDEYMKKILAYSLVSLTVVFLGGCNGSRRESDEGSGGTTRVPVRIAVVTKGSVDETISAPGMYDLLLKERIVAPVAGRVVSVEVREGQRVRAHDVVAKMRTREAESALIGAREMLRAAVSESEKAEAERAISLATSAAKDVVIRSTIDGIVSARNAMAGENLQEQADIVTIVDPSSVIFIADVPAASVQRIRAGMSATVEPVQDTRAMAKARVDAIYPSTDPASQSTRIRLLLARGQKSNSPIKAGTAGTAQITLSSRHDVMLVPEKALIHDDETDEYTLILVEPDSVACRIRVGVGGRKDSLREVQSPRLRVGMSVVTEGNYTLPDSARVTVEQ